MPGRQTSTASTAQRVAGTTGGVERVARGEVVGVDLHLHRRHASLVTQASHKAHEVACSVTGQHPAVHHLVGRIGAGRRRDVAHLHREHCRARDPEIDTTGVGTACVVPAVDHDAAVGASGAARDFVGRAQIADAREREVLDVREQVVVGGAITHRGERVAATSNEMPSSGKPSSRRHRPVARGTSSTVTNGRATAAGRAHELRHGGRTGVAGEPIHPTVDLGNRDVVLVEQGAEIGVGPTVRAGRDVFVVVDRHAAEPGRRRGAAR